MFYIYAGNVHLSSLLYCFGNGLVLKRKFKGEVKLIYGRLLPYQDNDAVLMNY